MLKVLCENYCEDTFTQHDIKDAKRHKAMITTTSPCYLQYFVKHALFAVFRCTDVSSASVTSQLYFFSAERVAFSMGTRGGDS